MIPMRIVFDDGRNFMARKGEPYDLIVSEPSNPWMTGAASLFTVEFFGAAVRRLNPGGIFLQWLQIYELAPDRIASILKTFHSVFPHVLVFSPDSNSTDILLVGSREALEIPYEQLERQFAPLAPKLATNRHS